MSDDPDSPDRRPAGPRRRVASRAGRLDVEVVAVQAGRLAGASGLAAWLARVAQGRVDGAVTVALVSDARMRALNRRYRHKDRVTDVLSFANDASAPFLGDIVIALGRARRQAREAGHPLADELRLLALHGLLHLAGYDHERDAGLMARVERTLRRKGGLATGLIERTRPAAAGRTERRAR